MFRILLANIQPTKQLIVVGFVHTYVVHIMVANSHITLQLLVPSEYFVVGPNCPYFNYIIYVSWEDSSSNTNTNTTPTWLMLEAC